MSFKIYAGEPHHAKGIAEVHVGSWRTTYKGIVADATLADMNIEVRIRQWAKFGGTGPWRSRPINF
jgi:hypothetical protein